MAKQRLRRRVKNLSSAKASNRPMQPGNQTRQQTSIPSLARRFVHWLSTSNWVLVLGVIVLATIITIMYYRLFGTSGTEQATKEIPSVVATPVSMIDGGSTSQAFTIAESRDFAQRYRLSG